MPGSWCMLKLWCMLSIIMQILGVVRLPFALGTFAFVTHILEPFFVFKRQYNFCRRCSFVCFHLSICCGLSYTVLQMFSLACPHIFSCPKATLCIVSTKVLVQTDLQCWEMFYMRTRTHTTWSIFVQLFRRPDLVHGKKNWAYIGRWVHENLNLEREGLNI